MTYVDYNKAYDIPHSWIIKILHLVGVADKTLNILKGSMTT